MTHPRNDVLSSRLEAALLALAALFLAVHTLPSAWKTLNTDFPNYYMSARLLHDHCDASRMYEWSWIEREKDHRALDLRVIGLLPITPFSTLAMLPFAGWLPLAAKHAWVLLSLALLFPIAWMLRSLAGLSYRRIALIFALCFPLHRNLEFGQYYVVLLFLITAACWAYLRGLHIWAGVLVAIATACKVFPVLFLVFFLRRRAWRALGSGALSLAVVAALSIGIFGWNVHRTYLQEILPWTMHGAAMPPYVPSASISGILHRLFLSEPQWNPHPWRNSPLCFALLMPTLQMLVLAPAILLIRRSEHSRERTLLEWSALLIASLSISTVPALYNFVLLALPVCVLAAMLLKEGRYGWLAALMMVYLGIGMPLPGPDKVYAFAPLLQIIRLPLLLVLLAGIYGRLWQEPTRSGTAKDWTSYAWSSAMIVATIVSVFSTLHREQVVRGEYAYRLSLQAQGFLNSHPQAIPGGTRYIAFNYSGYHLVTESPHNIQTEAIRTTPDELSFTQDPAPGRPEHLLVERALDARSQIIDLEQRSPFVVDDAREPMLSADGTDLAFLRDDRGRGRLMVHTAFDQDTVHEYRLTPLSMDVYEGSFLSSREYAFSAVSGSLPPAVYLTDATHANSLLQLGQARYPAISPDLRWMAYSRFEGGGWNLWIRDQQTGATRRISDVPCNQIESTWEQDSKTLLYSTDCGRSLWFTAISRRRVIP